MLRHADVLHYMGLIDKRQRINALQQQLEVAELITLGARALAPRRSLRPGGPAGSLGFSVPPPDPAAVAASIAAMRVRT